MRAGAFCIGWRGKILKVTLSRYWQGKGAMEKSIPQGKKQNHKDQEAFAGQKRGQYDLSEERQRKEMGQSTLIRSWMWTTRLSRRLA